MDTSILLSNYLVPAFEFYKKLVLLKIHNIGFPWCIAGVITATCMRLKAQEQAQKTNYYWLYSLILVVISTFGGGTVAFVMIARPPIIVGNEYIVPLCVIIWYLVFYCNISPILNSPPIKFLYTFFAMLFRTHSVCNILEKATSTLTSNY